MNVSYRWDSGKTSLMAVAASRATTSSHVVVLRFIGTTALSCTGRCVRQSVLLKIQQENSLVSYIFSILLRLSSSFPL